MCILKFCIISITLLYNNTCYFQLFQVLVAVHGMGETVFLYVTLKTFFGDIVVLQLSFLLCFTGMKTKKHGKQESNW